MVEAEAAKKGGAEGRSLYKLYANLLQEEKPDGYVELRTAFNREAKQAKPAAETEAGGPAAAYRPFHRHSGHQAALQPICPPPD